MCGPYWSQWNADDLRDWMGKDDVPEPDVDVDKDPKEIHDCGNCLKCLDLHHRDFC